MPAPKVSVIIPCYNMDQFMKECLDSVLAQTLSEIEVVCVNDGSTDSTLQILEQYHSKDARVIIINQENKGVSAARNIAMRKATGEFIAFMDPDDFYPDTHTLELLYTKATDNHALICGGSMSTFLQTSGVIDTFYTGDMAKNTFHQEGFIDYRDYQYDFSFTRFLYNRVFLLENNLFFPPYVRFEDPPFFVRSMIAAGSFYAVPDVVYRGRHGNPSATVTWSSEKVRDLMLGHIDDLVLSAQHHLSQLHALTVRRFEENVAKIPMLRELRSGSPEAFSLLKQVNSAICPDLLREAGVPLNADGTYLLHGYENWLTAASVEEGNAKMIPVVLAADENYVIPMSVTIGSLLFNAVPETGYDIYILSPDEFSVVSKTLLQAFEEKYPGCKINFLVVKDMFDDGHPDSTHLTKTTFYRLLIPSLLPQYDKCIYLDADVIVNADLTDLYRTNMDDSYIAGVRDAWYMHSAEKIAYETQRLNLPSVDNYINGGVLVMNLEKLRKHGLQKTFVALSAKFNDQDILNICCYNNIKMLPLTFNVLAPYVCRKNGQYSIAGEYAHIYPEDEQIAALKKPAIIHYVHKKKPWNHPDIALSECWVKYVPCSTFCFDQLHRPVVQRIKGRQQQLNIRCQSLSAENLRLKKSVSFRIGQIITYIPRKLRGAFRFCREYGFARTTARAFQKFSNKFKK